MLRVTDTIRGNCTTQAARKWLAAVDALLKDARTPDRLKAILSRYRIMRWRQHECPSRDSVRETLKRLARMQQKEAAFRWSKLDETVKVEIRRATRKINCPDNLPEAAKMALESMAHKQAGRKHNAESAVLFARDLARYWYETTGQKPTVQASAIYETSHHLEKYPPTNFQKWAYQLFKHAGFSIGDINKTLQAGVKASKEVEDIPK